MMRGSTWLRADRTTLGRGDDEVAFFVGRAFSGAVSPVRRRHCRTSLALRLSTRQTLNSQRIKRQQLLGGLINEYERAA
jgi:hypothetical protein